MDKYFDHPALRQAWSNIIELTNAADGVRKLASERPPEDHSRLERLSSATLKGMLESDIDQFTAEVANRVRIEAAILCLLDGRRDEFQNFSSHVREMVAVVVRNSLMDEFKMVMGEPFEPRRLIFDWQEYYRELRGPLKEFYVRLARCDLSDDQVMVENDRAERAEEGE